MFRRAWPRWTAASILAGLAWVWVAPDALPTAFAEDEKAPVVLRPSATHALPALRQYKSPTCLAFSPDGTRLYVTCYTASSLAVVDIKAGKVIREVPVGRGPVGVAASPDGRIVFVANSHDHTISFVSTKTWKVAAEVRCGLDPRGLAVAANAKWLYSANYVSNDVSVIDVVQRKQVARIGVGRAPTRLTLTPDGKTLAVNNSLSHAPATDPKVTSYVSVIDTGTRKEIARPTSPGTMLLGMGITTTRDGRYAFALHHRPNFNVTPSQLFQGWVHTNALSIVPLRPAAKPKAPPKGKVPPKPTTIDSVATVLLDNANSGAANPHEIILSHDAKTLLITHRGIHKVSVVDLARLRGKILSASPAARKTMHTNMSFLWDTGEIVRRVDAGGKGPKGIAVSPADGRIYMANYFSDNVAELDPRTFQVARRIPLGPQPKWTAVRQGEFLFNDAVHCFQQWLSCTSCHPDVRVDGVNWDLLNDGMTNPKNAKSLVGAYQTPPSMSLGVRARMEVAAEKGFLFIQFVKPTRPEVDAVVAYLRSVPNIRSPLHRKPDGSLDAAAMRGKKVFENAGCSGCHPAPLYTDLEMYDVGTRGKRDLPKQTEFDTPSLLELYRTAPYLHDGRAATLEEVFTKFNKDDDHGSTSELSKKQLADLVAFLESL